MLNRRVNQRGLLSACLYAALAISLVLHSGCTAPYDFDGEDQLRESLIASHQRHLESVSPGPVIEIEREVSDVEKDLTEERRAELDEMGGAEAYKGEKVNIGPDLLGQEEMKIVELSLQNAIETAVKYNLDLQELRIAPAVAQTQTLQEEAAFDATFFTSFEWQNTDPAAAPILATAIQSETLSLSTGIRKRLITGGSVAVQTNLDRTETKESASLATDPLYWEGDIILSMQQPLLRGFGTDVNRFRILLAENTQRSESQTLRQNLIELNAAVERAYWDLVYAKSQLMIQTRLYERTIEDRNRLKQREDFDVNPVRLTEANSFVELRHADVIRARQNARVASDNLKLLMNSPELPISDETLLLPVDAPVDEPIAFSLHDAVATALRHRPELNVALLQIKDASIRQRVADSLRLPQLDITGQIAFNGLGRDDIGDIYRDIGDGEYIDYGIGLEFEMPIGNRQAEAQYKQFKLEREQAVLSYMKLSQQVVLEVKNALRDLLTSYELIGATRSARYAATDALRAIEEQEAAGMALTPEFLLDLKLSAQDRLANSENQESQALTDYNTAIADLYRVMGTLLDRNGIVFDESVD